MILGIVGHGQDKFSKESEAIARAIIQERIEHFVPDAICSGHSPSGGVDIYAEQIADRFGMKKIIYEPKVFSWYGIGGYRERNLKIAQTSDLVLCVVIARSILPLGVRDFGNGICYHCKGRNPDRVKSGGCWTAWKCSNRQWMIVK